jgi:hypothetical protein
MLSSHQWSVDNCVWVCGMEKPYGSVIVFSLTADTPPASPVPPLPLARCWKSLLYVVVCGKPIPHPPTPHSHFHEGVCPGGWLPGGRVGAPLLRDTTWGEQQREGGGGGSQEGNCEQGMQLTVWFVVTKGC